MKECITNVSSNLIQNTIRHKEGNPAIGPLRPARSEDSSLIQEISKKIAFSELPSDSVQFTTGFGIHTSFQFPVRAPAILLPTLHVMEEMKRIGLDIPSYVVYQATSFIAETNQLDIGRSHESSEKLESYLRRYVDTFHKKIAEHVHFEFGCDYSESERQSIQNISDMVRLELQDLMEVKQATKKIQNYEKKNSNGIDSFNLYAAANALYSGATPEYPFEEKTKKKVRLLIPVGGPAEKPFFEVTSAVADSHQLQRKVVPFMTPLGSRPTYYPYKESGDPMHVEQFASAMITPHKDGPIRGDINSMIADGATPETLRTIYPEQ